jgi:hypothetical protein
LQKELPRGAVRARSRSQVGKGGDLRSDR